MKARMVGIFLSKLQVHESYRDRFGLRYAMFKKAGEGLPLFLQTDFVVGNGIIRARMAEGLMLNPSGNLTNINILMGSRKHPYYEPPCFIAAASNKWNWRNSWFYAVRCDRRGGWRTLDENGTDEVSVSYVLGSAVTKTVSVGRELDVVIYTFAPPGMASVVQIMEVQAKKRVQSASVIAHLNPLMPSRPYSGNYTIKESYLQEEADGDEVESIEPDGSSVEFSDCRFYDLRLAFGSNVKPSARGVGSILLSEQAYQKAYDPKTGEIWSCRGERRAGPGNVYSSMRYDLGAMEKGETRRLVFAASLAHGQKEVRNELASALKADHAELLKKSVESWRRQLGYSDPSTELEARFQLGFISLGLHRATNGGIEESDGEWAPAVYPRDIYWCLKAFYVPYGNVAMRMKWIRDMIRFVYRGWKRYGIRSCYFLNEDEPGLQWPYTLTEYPSKYVLIVQDYVQYTGDWSIVSEVWPMLDDCVMTQVRQHLAKGIAPLDIDAHIYWWGLAKKFSKADVKFRMSSAMLLSSALRFVGDAAKRLGKPAGAYKRSRGILVKAIEKNLHPDRNGVYAAVRFKDGRLMFLPGVDWAKEIWLGNITGKAAEKSLRIIEKLPEFKYRSPFDGDIQLAYSGTMKNQCGYDRNPANVHMLGQTWAYYIKAALKLGHVEKARRWAMNAFKLVSPSGGLSAHYEGVARELVCTHDYNFPWSSVLFRAVMDYICLVEPLGTGIANGIRLKSEDLDGILEVGESIGNPKDFQVMRTGAKEVTCRSGFLAAQFGRNVEIKAPATGTAEIQPAAILKTGIVLTTGDTVEIRPVGASGQSLKKAANAPFRRFEGRRQ